MATQEIYTSDKIDAEPQNIKDWTVDELKDALVATESINKFYATSDKRLFLTSHDDEKWRPCLAYNSKHNRQVYASNYGRIKINDEICELYEECDKSSKLNKDTFKKMLDDKKSVGWLLARRNGYVRGLGEYVYNLVAYAWLRPRKTGEVVHHITNDGYDNRPQNLILLTVTDHNVVHNHGRNPGKIIDYNPMK